MTQQVDIKIELDDEGYALFELFVDQKLIGQESIGGEPEDNSYYRDYNWIPSLMKKLAIELGAIAEVEITEI